MMSSSFPSPEANQSKSTLKLLSNPNDMWSRNPAAQGNFVLNTSSSPSLVMQNAQIEAQFPRMPINLPDSEIPSKSGNYSPKTPTQLGPDHNDQNTSLSNGKAKDQNTKELLSSSVVQPASNAGSGDLVTALNSYFYENNMSPERRTEVNASPNPLAGPSDVDGTTSQHDDSQFILKDRFISNPTFLIPESDDESPILYSNHPLPPESLASVNDPRLSISDVTSSSAVQEHTYRLLTTEDAIEFNDMEIAPVSHSYRDALSEEQRRREATVNTAFLRKHLATFILPTLEEGTAPKFGAVPYRPISARSDELVEELFGSGDKKRGRTWTAPKFRADKTKSTSSVADDDDAAVSDVIVDEGEGPAVSPTESTFPNVGLNAGTSNASAISVEGELLPEWDSDSIPNSADHTPDLIPTSDDFGIMDDISSLQLNDGLENSSDHADQSTILQEDDVEMDVEPVPVPQRTELPDELASRHPSQPVSFHDFVPDAIFKNHEGAGASLPQISFGQPHLLGPSFAPLTPETFFGINHDDATEEPLAPTTEIEEVTEDTTQPNVTEGGQPPISDDPIATQPHTDSAMKFLTSNPPNNIATSSLTQTTPQPNSRLPWSSLTLTIFDTKSSAWSEENVATLQRRFGTFDSQVPDDSEERLLIGLRPAIPASDDEVWYEFSDDSEGIDFGSDQEEIPLFLPSYTDTDVEDEDEVIDISDDELLISPVATLQTAKKSPSPIPLHKSSKRRHGRTSDRAEKLNSNAAGPSTTPQRLTAERVRPSPWSSSILNIDSGEDELQDDMTPSEMGPPSRKRKRLAEPTLSNPTTPSRSSRHPRR